MSLRERKKEATKEALQEAAVRLFASRGYAGTSIDAIADAANVSRSTYFRYFSSKADVLFSERDEAGERFLDLLASRPAGDGPIAAFEDSLVELVSSVDVEPRRELLVQRARLVREEPALKMREAEEQTVWTERCAAAFAARAGRAEAETDDLVAAAVCIAVTERIGEQWRAASEGPAAIDLIRQKFASLRRLACDDRPDPQPRP